MKWLCMTLVIVCIAGMTAPVCLAQEDASKKVLKEGLLGAATGAVAAGASGGKAGKGALIGAGVNVVGGALLDTITGPAAPAPQQVQQVPVQTVPVQVAPSPYQQGYNDGYQKGFESGYEKGYAAGMSAKR
ncbi:MAG: hypothetical protein HY589_03805 [Candidatus Omnitrophica bacterium]|nr:hypothetical protein [Candidatus Omnitrophota bacterium]